MPRLERSGPKTTRVRLRVADLPPEQPAQHPPMERNERGHFLPGNRSATARSFRLRVDGRSLFLIDHQKADPRWRPFLKQGVAHLRELLKELPKGASKNALALLEELSISRTVSRWLMQLASEGDREALKEARAWMTHSRQIAITLHAILGTAAKPSEGGVLDWMHTGEPDDSEPGDEPEVDA